MLLPKIMKNKIVKIRTSDLNFGEWLGGEDRKVGHSCCLLLLHNPQFLLLNIYYFFVRCSFAHILKDICILLSFII